MNYKGGNINDEDNNEGLKKAKINIKKLEQQYEKLLE